MEVLKEEMYIWFKLKPTTTERILKAFEVMIKYTETYLVEMDHFVKLIDGYHPLTIVAKSSILDVWQGFQYISHMCSITWLKPNLRQVRYFSPSG